MQPHFWGLQEALVEEVGGANYRTALDGITTIVGSTVGANGQDGYGGGGGGGSSCNSGTTDLVNQRTSGGLGGSGTVIIRYAVVPLSVQVSAISTPSCNGSSDGVIVANASLGALNYTYLWSTGDSTQNTASSTDTLSGLTGGVYSVTVVDGIGDSIISSFTLVEPLALSASASISSPLDCNGDSDGQVAASATGGTSPYLYSWNTSGTSAIETGLLAGTYSVTITDSNGCTDSASVVLTQPASLSAGASNTGNVSCNGGSDGSASVSGSGGTMPYTYAWSNSTASATATGLSAGTYTVTVTDANSCTSTATVTITEPTALSASAANTGNVSCNGGSNGSASVSGSGGTTPYTYAWSNSTTSTSATGLSAGTYTVTVTDANSCTSTATVTITQPTALSASATNTGNVSCNGGSDGSASVSGSGGTTPYTYAWSNSTTSTTATGLSAGTYTVTVTDANSCTSTATVTITQPTALSASATNTGNVSCNGGSDGSASVSGSGGTTPYTYAWSNSTTSTTATGLSAGTYTVTVTDANSCTSTATVTITQPTALSSSATNTGNVSCNGGSDGSASVSGSGGTTPYTYAWSNSTASATATGLSAGTYTVTVTDANSCTSTATVTITEPTALSASAANTGNVSCNGGSDGSASVSGSGGTTPYTYAWSNSTASATATGLSAGTYTVTVTDANSCTSTATVTITEPTALSASAANTGNVSCNGGSNGSASVSGSGGTTPYTYAWSNSTTSTSATGLSAGTYTVTVTDANSCTSTATVTITQPTALSASATNTGNVSCNGGSDGSASVSGSGGTTPYTYAWSSSTTSTTATGLSAGTYTVTVTDANSCTSTATVTITQPTALSSSATNTGNVSCNGGSDGSASVSGSGGTTPYTYAWSNSTASATATGLSAGTYTVTVTDANSCTSTATVTITEPTALSASAANTGNVSCNGGSNGSASVSGSGGTTPYTYAWSNSSTSTSATGLSAGTYTVTVTDANSCTSTSTVTLTEPTALVVGLINQVGVSCVFDTNGTATVTASGGTPGYTYLWSNLDTTMTNTTLGVGAYSVTVTDVNGCEQQTGDTIIALDFIAPVAQAQDLTVYLNAQGLVEVTVQQVDSGSTDNCVVDTMYLGSSVFGCAQEGVNEVQLFVVDGTGNIDSASFELTVLDTVRPVLMVQNISLPLDHSGLGFITAQDMDSGSFDNCAIDTMYLDRYEFGCGSLGDNQVKFYAVDVSGNIDSVSVTVRVIDTTAPMILVHDTTLYLDGNGFVAIEPGLFDDGTSDNCEIASLYLNTASFECSQVGSNSVVFYAVDPSGNLDSQSVSVIILDSIAPTLTCPESFASCDSLLTFDLPIASDVCGIESLVQFSGLEANAIFPEGITTIEYRVTDVSGNEATCGFEIERYPLPVIIAPRDSSVVFGEPITLDPIDSLVQDYQWEPSDFLDDPFNAAPVARPEETITYTVTGYSNDGCLVSDQVVITVINDLRFAQAFSPNGDGVNDVFYIEGIGMYTDCRLTIVNRYGLLVYESVGYQEPWDGTYKGELMPVGSYFFVIDLGEKDGRITGAITIIR